VGTIFLFKGQLSYNRITGVIYLHIHSFRVLEQDIFVEAIFEFCHNYIEKQLQVSLDCCVVTVFPYWDIF
jgi:hypothetical protein